MRRLTWLISAWLLSATVARAEAGSPAMSARIDALLAERWAKAGIEPARDASDEEFLRRVSLDLTGIIPTVSDVRQFLADPQADKRRQWIERILARPNHPTHLAGVWRRALLPESSNLARFGGSAGFESWLRNHFAANTPYDQVVREIITSTGNANGTPNSPAVYFTALEFKPEELAASSSKFFLGVQIQCAQCHNHPFDHWKQHDFWGYAAFFAQVQREQRQPIAPLGFAPVVDAARGEVKFPGTETIVPPRYLGAEQPLETAGPPRRLQLAAWLASRDNPYFARATANRIWAHLFGRGLVEPVDDLGPHNPASHPQLLDELTQQFIDTGFDVRSLLSMLANTRAYQLSSETAAERETPPELFARMSLRTLTAEQLYDCLAEATRRREGAATAQPRSIDRVFDLGRQSFLSKFQSTSQPTDFQSGIPQALTLMNGQVIATGTDLQRSDLLAALDAPFLTDRERIDTLFLSALSRFPREEERETFAAYLQGSASSTNRRKALGDILWALLNSAEFVLNH